MKKASPDEYEDEGFEDYDEDFEDDNEPVVEASNSSRSNSSRSSKVVPPSNHYSSSIANQSTTPAPFIAQAKSNNVISSLSKSVTKPTLNRSGDAKSNNTARTADSKPASTRVKKYDSMQISFTQSITDSRGARIRKLLDSGLLDMQMQRVTIWNVPPTTPYDFYINNLRSSTSNVKQVGIPMDLEKRDMSTETEPIDTADKGLQFTYGDDTDFYDLLQEVKDSREHHGKGNRTDGGGGKSNEIKQGRSGATDSDSTVNNDGVESASSNNSSFDIGATRLTSFLQRASFLCEAVLQDQEINTNGKAAAASLEVESKKQKSDNQIFDSSSEWKQFGTDYTKGANETIRFRSISYLRFSSLQPNLVISAHPYPTDEATAVNEDELDFKPYKGLYCMWDVSSPSVPLYLLSATGQPTCCCFSDSQSHLVIGGTNEGSLHLWDLRENSSLHKDRDVEELRIERGLRKPCYSTNLSYVSGTPSGDLSTSDDWQGHSTSILQVESLSSYDSSTNASPSSSFPSEQGMISQFVSIDESGLVIFWITSNRHKMTSTTQNDDLQRSPWSGIALMQTRQIDTNKNILYTHRLNNNNAWSSQTDYHSPLTNKKQQSGSDDSSFSSEGAVVHVSDKSVNKGCPVQGNASLAIIPHDVSTLLVYRSEGSIFKVSRFGHPDPPHILQRVRTNHTDIDIIDNNDISSSSSSKSGKQKQLPHSMRNPEINYFSPVSCMHVRPPIASPNRVDVAHDQQAESKIDSHTNSVNISTSALLLVGRFDGTVDLFELDTEHPILSWNLVDLSTDAEHHKSTKMVIKSVVVVMVHWCPNRAASFFVADSSGLIYYFDLNRYSSKPVYIEAVTVASSLSTGCIDLSSCLRHGGSSDGQLNIVFSVKNNKSNGDNIKCKRVNRIIAKQTGAELSNEEELFRASLHNLSANKIIAQSVTFMPDVSNNDSK